MPSAVQTLSEDLDNLYTTTWQNRKEGKLADNIFDATPFYFWLRDKNKLDPRIGGRHIEEPIVYAKNENTKWITKGGTTSLSDFEFMTLAVFQWYYLAVPIVRFGVDDQKNSGKNQILNFMNAKLDNAENSLIDELEAKLASGDNSASDAISGLKHLVQDDPTSSTDVGGINQSTHSFWRNKTKDMTGSSFATNGVDEMRTMLNNCSQNRTNDRPDILLTSQTVFEYYEDIIFGKYETSNRKLADAGFENQTFKSIPMIWSPQISQRMYFLNTNFLKLVYDPRMFFDMTEWKPIPEQPNDRAAQIVSAMTMTTNRRRVHGVIHTIDTP